GAVVVERNKNRVEGNNLILQFGEKAKTADELYDIARNHFDNERTKLKEKYGNTESEEKNNAYDDLRKTESHVFTVIDGINAEANPEMAARNKAQREAEAEQFKIREENRKSIQAQQEGNVERQRVKEGEIVQYGKKNEKSSTVKYIDPNSVRVITTPRERSQSKLTNSTEINVPVVLDAKGRVIDGNNRVIYAKEN